MALGPEEGFRKPVVDSTDKLEEKKKGGGEVTTTKLFSDVLPVSKWFLSLTA